MFTISKSLIIAAAALAATTSTTSTTSASAETPEKINFKYDMNAPVEQNYAAFARTAKRACSDASPLQSYKRERACRRELLNQAVALTKQGKFTAYHQFMTGQARSLASLRGR